MRKMPPTDIQEGLTNSDILSSQMRKMSTPDIQEKLANSDILELTNEDYAYCGYSEGAYQFEISWGSQMKKMPTADIQE
jgi:hypothetical protein